MGLKFKQQQQAAHHGRGRQPYLARGARYQRDNHSPPKGKRVNRTWPEALGTHVNKRDGTAPPGLYIYPTGKPTELGRSPPHVGDCPDDGRSRRPDGQVGGKVVVPSIKRDGRVLQRVARFSIKFPAIPWRYGRVPPRVAARSAARKISVAREDGEARMTVLQPLQAVCTYVPGPGVAPVRPGLLG